MKKLQFSHPGCTCVRKKDILSRTDWSRYMYEHLPSYNGSSTPSKGYNFISLYRIEVCFVEFRSCPGIFLWNLEKGISLKIVAKEVPGRKHSLVMKIIVQQIISKTCNVIRVK